MVNKVILVGNLGKDPEMKEVNGTNVTKFSVATSERWKDKSTGEQKEKTEWHSCFIWGAQAQSCAQYLSKGSKVFIEGSIESRQYEQDGVTKYISEIRCRDVRFLDSKRDTSNGAIATNAAPTVPQDDLESPIPF